MSLLFPLSPSLLLSPYLSVSSSGCSSRLPFPSCLSLSGPEKHINEQLLCIVFSVWGWELVTTKDIALRVGGCLSPLPQSREQLLAGWLLTACCDNKPSPFFMFASHTKTREGRVMKRFTRPPCRYEPAVSYLRFRFISCSTFWSELHPDPNPPLPPPPADSVCSCDTFTQMPHMRLEEQATGARRYQDVERGGSVQVSGGATAQVGFGCTPSPSPSPSPPPSPPP